MYECASSCDIDPVPQKILCNLCEEPLGVVVQSMHQLMFLLRVAVERTLPACRLQEHKSSHVHVSLQDRVKPEALRKMSDIRNDVEYQMNLELGDSTNPNPWFELRVSAVVPVGCAVAPMRFC